MSIPNFPKITVHKSVWAISIGSLLVHYALPTTNIMHFMPTVLAIIMISMLLHEIGHGAMGAIFGFEVHHIEMHALGAVIRMTKSNRTTRIENILVCLSGPAMNLLVAMACLRMLGGHELLKANENFLESALNGSAGGFSEWRAFLFAGMSINALMFAINILPISPLDGGRAIECCLSTASLDRFRGRLIPTALSLGVGVALASTGNLVFGAITFAFLSTLQMQSRFLTKANRALAAK